MDPADLEVLASLAAAVDPDGVIVEAGSWLGQSTRTLAVHARCPVYALDLWAWMPKSYSGPASDKVDLAGDPYEQFAANVSDLANVVPLRRRSSGGVWKYGAPDVAFIDAMHQNPWVMEDLAYWSDLVKPGGVICGDDYSPRFPAVQSEAQALADRLNVELELPATKLWLIRMPGGGTSATQTKARS